MKTKTITIINQVAQLDVVATELEALALEWHLPAGELMKCNLVLEEIITNIIFYGYDDTLEHLITIRLTYDDDRLMMQIEDDAKEFNPLLATVPDITAPPEERPVGGLGIHFIRQLMDEATYERRTGKNLFSVMRRIPTDEDTRPNA